MKKKTKNIKIFLTVIALLILIFIVREKYYEMKLSMQKENNLNDAQISNQNINNTNNINDINNTYNLEELANRNPQIKKIMHNKEKYPGVLLEMLSRNMDMLQYVSGYLDSKGKVTSSNIGEISRGTVPLLLQYDTRWGYGITGTEIPLSRERMISELEQGHPIICSVGKGDFTTTGHIIVITGVENEMFTVNDPNSKERSSKLWSYERIKNQIKNLWAYKI